MIVAWDREFYEQLPALFPHADARSWFTGSPEAAKETAFRNSSLQAGYLILAARSLGLDAGPMSRDSTHDAGSIRRNGSPAQSSVAAGPGAGFTPPPSRG